MLFVLLATVTCAKESEKPAPPIEVDFKTGGKCVTNISQEIGDYADGKMAPREVGEFWDCLGHAVSEFQRLTTGDHGDSYSPQALRAFLQKYFIKEHTVDDGLMLSVMELKRVFLAGSAQSLTRDELSRLQELMMQLKTISLILQPHARVLFLRETHATDAQVRAAAAAMRAAIDVLAAWLNQRQQSYSFAQLDHFLEALEAWMSKSGGATGAISTFREAVNLMPEAKRMLIGGNRAVVEGPEWLAVGGLMARVFHFYLASRFSFADDVENGFTRPVLPESINEMLDALVRAALVHRTGGIPVSEVHDLFVKLEATAWLPSAFKVDAMDKAFAWVLRRPLGDHVTQYKELSLSHISILRTHIELWRVLIGSPGVAPNVPLSDHFNALIAQSPSLEWDALGRMVFNAHPPIVWSANNIRHSVMPYTLLRMLKEAYTDRTEDYIIHEEMDTAVGEVLPLLQNFGWLLTSNMSLSNKRFRESDLFSLSGNGDDHLELGEAVRYMGLVMSAFRSAQVWLETADRVCGSREPVCVRNLALDPRYGVLDATPRFKAIIPLWGKDRFLKYMTNAEFVANGYLSTGTYSIKDLMQTYQLFEYAETYLQRFDFDANEIITTPEGLASYPVYGPTINKLMMGGSAPDDLVKGIFTFMLKYGNTPDNMFGGLLLFANWQMHKDSWVLRAERDNLMNILSELSKR